jgi:23S rRNA (cytosine1962-C5)-methyltransferase
LAPGGILVTCSCSYHLSGPKFEEILRQAATELPFRTFLSERIGAGPDHPVWIHLPESEYLKVCVLRRPKTW